MTDRARRGPAAPRVRLPYARSRAYNDVRLPRGPRCPVARPGPRAGRRRRRASAIAGDGADDDDRGRF